jgi:hypothetical protein
VLGAALNTAPIHLQFYANSVSTAV